jgi:hypothetical protein
MLKLTLTVVRQSPLNGGVGAGGIFIVGSRYVATPVEASSEATATETMDY